MSRRRRVGGGGKGGGEEEVGYDDIDEKNEDEIPVLKYVSSLQQWQ